MSYPTILPMSAAILEEVSHERVRQHGAWGEQNHPNGTGATMTTLNRAEEAKEACDYAFRHGMGTWRHILEEEFREAMAESDRGRLRAELIQVAAVAVAWVEALDRSGS